MKYLVLLLFAFSAQAKEIRCEALNHEREFKITFEEGKFLGLILVEGIGHAQGRVRDDQVGLRFDIFAGWSNYHTFDFPEFAKGVREFRGTHTHQGYAKTTILELACVQE